MRSWCWSCGIHRPATTQEATDVWECVIETDQLCCDIDGQTMAIADDEIVHRSLTLCSFGSLSSIGSLLLLPSERHLRRPAFSRCRNTNGRSANEWTTIGHLKIFCHPIETSPSRVERVTTVIALRGGSVDHFWGPGQKGTDRVIVRRRHKSFRSEIHSSSTATTTTRRRGYVVLVFYLYLYFYFSPLCDRGQWAA